MPSAITIEEIAEKAEVSRSTVSRVLNNHPSVRPSVRDRVLRVMREQNYAPRAAARSLASKRTQSIGVLFPSSVIDIFHDPFFPILVQGIMETANKRGYFVMLSMATADTEQNFYAKVLRSRPFDGMIVLATEIDDPLLPLVISDRIPLVLCEKHPYLPHISWIDVDNRACAHRAVSHLLSLGHRRIATITGPLHTPSGTERRDGYKQALLEQAIGIAPELIVEGDFAPEGGYAAMQQLLALPNPPTAVFAASDLMAMGAMRAIRAAGLRVPQDIAIVGFDDLPAARFSDVPLTTIRQPILQIGASAAELLIDQLEQQDFTPIHRLLATQLIVRESCGASLQQPELMKGGGGAQALF